MSTHLDRESGPFSDLPAALVDDVIGQCHAAGATVLGALQSTFRDRDSLRSKLEQSGLVRQDLSLPEVTAPTTCATDGSYSVERLLTVDLAVGAAVAVEGLTPPSELRHWEAPWHVCFVEAEQHNEKTGNMVRAAMLGEELKLATKAPHQLVLLDCTLTLPVIYFNQALTGLSQARNSKSAKRFVENLHDYLEAYVRVLLPRRSDQDFVGVPKYSTRSEIVGQLGLEGIHDDRGLLSLILRPGEYTTPMDLQSPDEPWHMAVEKAGASHEIRDLNTSALEAIKTLQVVYYRPRNWLPAMRLEMSRQIAQQPSRLGSVLKGIQMQSAAASMFEPYPLYLADRTVKSLAHAVPTLRQVMAQSMAETYEGEIGDVYLALHGYRSENGR